MPEQQSLWYNLNMIKRSATLKKFHSESIRLEKFSYPQALKIFEGLFREAKSLGIINSTTVREGLEANLRIARILDRSCHV